MLIVEVNSNIERALKTLKGKVIKTKQTKLLNQRKEYVKKSVKKRLSKNKAVYVQKFKKESE
jgi:small subunit ribosomal protein S21